MDPIVWIVVAVPVILGLVYVAQTLRFRLISSTGTKDSVISAAETEERADQLLRDTLSPKWYYRLRREGMIVLSRVPGYSYLVGNTGSVTLITQQGERVFLCVADSGFLPVSDRILTMIRHLQANEIGLIKIAGFGGNFYIRKRLLQELNRSQRPS